MLKEEKEGETLYARNIGISTLSGESVYELFVLGKTRRGALKEITSAIELHQIDITSNFRYQVYPSGEFVVVGFLEFRDTSAPPDLLVSEIRRLPFVTRAEIARPHQSIFERYLFPVTIMDKHRVIVFRIEPLLQIEKRLEEFLGTAGSTIMFEMGRSYGLAIVKTYRKDMPLIEGDVLMKRILSGARVTGWGLFEFTAFENDRIDASIFEPPTAVDPSVGKSWFTYGLVAGLIEGTYGVKVGVVADSYDAESRTLRLKLSRIGR
ncbi:MAG: hypothetical protein JRN52_01590 [Nitrososphaerota archaeon]|nr:hypothetical protein [Nitrososphaerota archaeon]